MRGWWMVLAAMLLAGCEPMVLRDGASWRWRPLPAGSSVELHRPLALPAGATRIFFQGGAAMALTQVRQLQPHCHFEMGRLDPASRTVGAGRYPITAVSSGEEEVVRWRPLRYASAFTLARDDDGPSSIARYLRFQLAAAGPGSPRHLTCHGAFDDPADARPPSVAEMREALGGLVSLHLP